MKFWKWLEEMAAACVSMLNDILAKMAFMWIALMAVSLYTDLPVSNDATWIGLAIICAGHDITMAVMGIKFNIVMKKNA